MLDKVKRENDSLANQLLVSQEESQEANRVIKDLESQLAIKQKDAVSEIAKLTL